MLARLRRGLTFANVCYVPRPRGRLQHRRRLRRQHDLLGRTSSTARSSGPTSGRARWTRARSPRTRLTGFDITVSEIRNDDVRLGAAVVADLSGGPPPWSPRAPGAAAAGRQRRHGRHDARPEHGAGSSAPPAPRSGSASSLAAACASSSTRAARRGSAPGRRIGVPVVPRDRGLLVAATQRTADLLRADRVPCAGGDEGALPRDAVPRQAAGDPADQGAAPLRTFRTLGAVPELLTIEEHDCGLSWVIDEPMQRASHALVDDGPRVVRRPRRRARGGRAGARARRAGRRAPAPRPPPARVRGRSPSASASRTCACRTRSRTARSRSSPSSTSRSGARRRCGGATARALVVAEAVGTGPMFGAPGGHPHLPAAHAAGRPARLRPRAPARRARRRASTARRPSPRSRRPTGARASTCRRRS